jgi:hypothetical protein
MGIFFIHSYPSIYFSVVFLIIDALPGKRWFLIARNATWLKIQT